MLEMSSLQIMLDISRTSAKVSTWLSRILGVDCYDLRSSVYAVSCEMMDGPIKNAVLTMENVDDRDNSHR